MPTNGDTIVAQTGHAFSFHAVDMGRVERWEVRSPHGSIVAYLNFDRSENAVQIRDFHITEYPRQRPHPIICALMRLVGRQPPPHTYRRIGIGSILIARLKETAKERRYTAITGEIAPVDLSVNPSLPEWYEKRGFVVTQSAGKSVGVFSLRLEITKSDGT